MQDLAFSLEPLPPFRLDLTAWALRRRPINQIDLWDGETYSRALSMDDRAVFIQVNQSGAVESPRLHVKVTADRLQPDTKPRVIDTLNRLLGLRIDLRDFYRFAKTDLRLKLLAGRFSGLKPPRFSSVYEGIVNGVACQQLSLHVGLTLLNRLASRTGHAFSIGSRVRYAFPDAERLALLPMRSFRSLGFSTSKGLAIKTLSIKVRDRHFDPELLTHYANERAVESLLHLKGIGRWTAEYVLLRALGRTNIFPGDDIGARNNLARWLKLETTLNYESINQTLSKWRPYAGLLYFHLLLDGLEKSGQLHDNGTLQNAA